MSRVLTAFAVLLCLLFVGSWPGAAVRPPSLPPERSAEPLPSDVGDRDGVLDVVVREASSPSGDDGTGDNSASQDAPKPSSVELPIAGARIRAFAILDGRAHAAGETTSDAHGVARLTTLPRAEHWIVVDAPGHARASQMVVIVHGERRLDVALGSEHALDVEVRSDAGALIGGAEIEVRGSDPFPVGARAGADGKVRVGRLADGPYAVTVRAPGYEEATRRRVAEGAPCIVTLGRQGALVVSVVDEAGGRVQGARVHVASATLWPARVAETGASGTVRMGSLPPGSYALRSVHHALVSPIEIGVPLGRGEEKEIELKLAPGVMITAHVVDALEDDGVARARVVLSEGGLSPFPVEGVTDARGRVVLGPIARGSASLSARADGYVARGAVRVEDPPPPEVKITLARGGALVGRIVDARGYPVDGATIRVIGTDLEGMPIDEDPLRASFSDAHFRAALAGPTPLVPAGELGVVPGPVPKIPHLLPGEPAAMTFGPSREAAPAAEPWVSARDGTFKASPIAPGRVRALVRHPQYVEAMSEVVTLSSEKEARVQVVLSRGGLLEGRIVDTRGRAVVGAHVTALATRGSLERMTRSGTDGSFAFAALPEALTLLVARAEDPSQVAARLEVTVPEGGKKAVEIALGEPRPPLPVKVVDERGNPIDAAQVSAVSLDPGEALRTTAFTDARGGAELANALGLPLRIEARAPSRAAKVVVLPRESSAARIELGPSERVVGELWANRREPIEGADVALETDVGIRRVRTNREGAFTISEVSPGPARLRVRAKGRVPVVKDIVVADRGGRRPTELSKIELPEEGIVEGTVVDGKGNPVPGARVGKDAVPTYVPASGAPSGMAVTDGKGRFRLGELPEGTVVLEAYAPDVGRVRVTGVRVIAGRTTSGVKAVLAPTDPPSAEPLATGGVAVTLGETASGLDPAEVVLVAVADGSEAERAGLAVNDVLVEVAGKPVTSITEARARLSGPLGDDVVVKVRRAGRLSVLRVARERVRR